MPSKWLNVNRRNQRGITKAGEKPAAKKYRKRQQQPAQLTSITGRRKAAALLASMLAQSALTVSASMTLWLNIEMWQPQCRAAIWRWPATIMLAEASMYCGERKCIGVIRGRLACTAGGRSWRKPGGLAFGGHFVSGHAMYSLAGRRGFGVALREAIVSAYARNKCISLGGLWRNGGVWLCELQ